MDRAEAEWIKEALHGALRRTGVALMPFHLDLLTEAVLDLILQDRATAAKMVLAAQNRFTEPKDAKLLEIVAHGIATREEHEQGSMASMTFEPFPSSEEGEDLDVDVE